MSKISELSDGGSLVSSDYLIAVRSGGNVKVRMDQINVDQVDLGDNEFIRLGNSQDLTMVHTSTQSIINQAGIGDLLLHKAGATKLTINASGIDVTGTVTADGLTVDGASEIRSTLDATLNITSTAFTVNSGDVYGSLNFVTEDGSVASGRKNAATIQAINAGGSGSYCDLDFYTSAGTGATNTKSLKIAANGDISFYEDTGTTPKLFWDASAESLDLTGTGGLDVNTATGSVNIQAGNASADIALGVGSPSTANKVVVTAGGDVGIGTSSPDHILCLEDAEPTLRIFDAVNTLNQEQTIAFGTEPGDRTHAEIAGINTNTGNAAGALSFKTNAGSSVTEQMRIDASGQVQIGASAISSSQTSALLSVRKAGPSIEFGHNNAAGYGSTIGANASNGNPYVAFSAEPATTTLNAFRTRGLKGTVIAGGASGEITFNRVPLATADNQVPVESMRIDASGHAIIPAGVTLGTATGVYAAANTLDNYEEGLWTPVLTDGTTSYTLTVGHYTRVGRLVTVTCQYSSTLSTTATTGNAYITGLPVSNGVIRSVGAIHFRESVISYDVLTDGPILPIVNSSASFVDLIAMGSAGDYQKNIPLNELVNTSGGTANYITFTATYQTT